MALSKAAEVLRVKKETKKTNVDTSLSRDELLSRISIDPSICFGKPCNRGHRIWVSLILDFLAGGMTKEELLEEYPQLEPADIDSCIVYGAEMARERFVEIPFEHKE